MKNIIYLLILAAVLLACKSESPEGGEQEVLTLSELQRRVKQMEDSLNLMSKGDKRVPDILKIELINRHLEIANLYPESEAASESLDRIHMVYSGLGVYDKSAAYADTLLQRFPNYKDKLLMYESQGANYDIFIQPRDSAKVRYYYELLLKEDSTMSEEKRQGLVQRLKYNHLNFEDYLSQVISQEAI